MPDWSILHYSEVVGPFGSRDDSGFSDMVVLSSLSHVCSSVYSVGHTHIMFYCNEQKLSVMLQVKFAVGLLCWNPLPRPARGASWLGGKDN